MGCDDMGNLDTTALDQISDAAIAPAQAKRLFPSTATAVKTGSGAGSTGGRRHLAAPSRGL